MNEDLSKFQSEKLIQSRPFFSIEYEWANTTQQLVFFNKRRPKGF
jgi:hypothetical protein